MWKHLRTALIAGGTVGGPLLWLSTNSIATTVKEADSTIASNLEWFGWDNPPQALASAGADNTAITIGGVLVVLGVFALLSWLWENYVAKNKKRGSAPKEAGGGIIDGTEIEEAEWTDNEVSDDFNSSNFTLIRGGKVGKLIATGNRFGRRSSSKDG